MIEYVKPLGNKVSIEKVEPMKVSPGGISIPLAAQGETFEGFIRAKGRDVSEDLQIGDRVVYSKYGGSLVNARGQERLVAEETQVSCVINFNTEEE